MTEDVRTVLLDWLQDAWDPELSMVEWRKRLAGAGWATPTWPARLGGRDLPASAIGLVAATLAEFGAVGPPEGVGMWLAAPTLLEHGSDDLQARFLPPTVTGEITWCQLFSEPGAGSDLAGLTTKAEFADNEWRVSGQKVWNTSAHHADYGLLVARTNWDVPKHHGLTYFVLPMKQPGVEVRPLRQANGHASFNEVFLDGARIPASFVIGDVDGGWRVALATLAHERRAAIPSPPAVHREGRVWREATEEALHLRAPYRWYPQRAGRVDLLVSRALATGRGGDPHVRQELARAVTLAWTARWTAERAAAARKLGKPPGPEGSLGKLASSNVARAARAAHLAIAGPTAMLAGPDSPAGGIIAEIILSVPAVSIAGGTDEIQRNLIGERVLGLPKDPTLDASIPFRDLPKNRSLAVPALDRDGVQVAYDVIPGPAGATPLLLTHGYSASRAMWRPNLAALAATRTVVTWDMRGHGQSDSPQDPALYSHEHTVDDMVAVLEACRIPVAAVGGLSLGGFMSLDFHRTHPGRVRCLLLFDTGPGFNKDESRRAWNDYARRTADRLERDGTAALSSSPETARATANVTGLAHAARGMLTQQDASVIMSLRDITIPTLVLVGADDTNFLAAAGYMATAIRHAEKVIVPGAGHAANIDQPGAFNDAVVDFLARHA